MSGFLITSLMRIEYEQSGRVSLRDFYIRRAFRILPPFYVVFLSVTLLTAATAWMGNTLNPWAVAAQAGYLSNYYIVGNGWWFGRAPGSWIYWSLAIEEHYYLVFPFVYLALLRWVPRPRTQALVLLGAAFAILGWRLLLVYGLDVARDRIYVATDTRVDGILFGCALAVWRNPMLDGADRVRRLLPLWVPLGALAIILGQAITDPRIEQTFRYTLIAVGLWPLCILAMTKPDRAPVSWLNLGVTRYFGNLSYLFYLLHTTVIYEVLIHTHWHPVLRGAVAFAITFGVASALHFVVERPSATLRSKLLKSLRERSVRRLAAARAVA